MAGFTKGTLEVSDTTTDQDTESSHLWGVAVLEVGGVESVIITDFANLCVKSFFTKNSKRCHSRLQLNHQPLGITLSGDINVMVSVPELYQIVTVAVTPDLVHVAHINTRKKYIGLASLSSSKLAAGCFRAVDILNMQGEELKTIDPQFNWVYSPYALFMTVNQIGNLLVSDNWGEKVICLTPEGHMVWTYSCSKGQGRMRCPTGITITGEGDILVADSNFMNVIQLSSSGEYAKTVLSPRHGLKHPRGIFVDKHGTCFVCDSGKLTKFALILK